MVTITTIPATAQAAMVQCGRSEYRHALGALSVLNRTLWRANALVCLGAPQVDRDIRSLLDSGRLQVGDYQSSGSDTHQIHVGQASVDVPVRVRPDPFRAGWVLLESEVSVSLPQGLGALVLRCSTDGRAGGTLGSLGTPSLAWPSTESYALFQRDLLLRPGYKGPIRMSAQGPHPGWRNPECRTYVQLVLFPWDRSADHFESRVSQRLLDEAMANKFPELVERVLPVLEDGTYLMVHWSTASTPYSILQNVRSDHPISLSGSRIYVRFAPWVPRVPGNQLQIGRSVQSFEIPITKVGIVTAVISLTSPNLTERDPVASKAHLIHPGSRGRIVSEEFTLKDNWDEPVEGALFILDASGPAVCAYNGKYCSQ